MINIDFSGKKSHPIRNRILWVRSRENSAHNFVTANKPANGSSPSAMSSSNLLIKASNSNIHPLISKIQSLKTSVQALRSSQENTNSNIRATTSIKQASYFNISKAYPNNRAPHSKTPEQISNSQTARSNIHGSNSIVGKLSSTIQTSSANVKASNQSTRILRSTQLKLNEKNTPKNIINQNDRFLFPKNDFERQNKSKTTLNDGFIRAQKKRNSIKNLNVENYLNQFISKNVVKIELDKK